MILCDSGVRPDCKGQIHRKNRTNGAKRRANPPDERKEGVANGYIF